MVVVVRLNNWDVVVCLIRLICLSRFNSLLKCNPRYLAELVGNSIMLLMSGKDALELVILMLISSVFLMLRRRSLFVRQLFISFKQFLVVLNILLVYEFRCHQHISYILY